MPQSNSTLIYSATIRSTATCIALSLSLCLLLATSLAVVAEETAPNPESGAAEEQAVNNANKDASNETSKDADLTTETTEIDTNNQASPAAQNGFLPQQNHMHALAAALDPSEAVWLDEGEKRFISLYRPALQPAQMAIILMPDSIHKLAKQSLMRALYTELPNTDWSTLHISLPEVTENPTEDEALLAAARIATSIDFLLNKGIRSTALVAENHSAQRAIAASISQADATSGLVLWRVAPEQLTTTQLTALAQSQITVLDVVDHGISASEKIERTRKFYLAGFGKNYRLITSPKGEAGIKHTQQRVRDWLEKRFKKFD